MNQNGGGDDEAIELTLNCDFSNSNNSNNNNGNSNNNSDNNNNSNNNNNSSSDNDDSNSPTASGEMILAESPSYASKLTYTGVKFLSLISWIGSGIYSLKNIFNNSNTPEEQHMHVLNTIAKLNNHLLFLDKKIQVMNLNCARFSNEAKRLYKLKNMTSAMHQIRLKKMYDCEINKLEKLKFNIETNILHMDSVEIMLVTVDTIKDTSEHFQQINSTINIEKLEDTIDELVEHRDGASDIQSVLSDMQLFRSNDATYDDQDLMEELEIMTNETKGSTENGIEKEESPPKSAIQPEDLPLAPTSALPSAPTSALPSAAASALPSAAASALPSGNNKELTVSF